MSGIIFLTSSRLFIIRTRDCKAGRGIKHSEKLNKLNTMINAVTNMLFSIRITPAFDIFLQPYENPNSIEPNIGTSNCQKFRKHISFWLCNLSNHGIFFQKIMATMQRKVIYYSELSESHENNGHTLVVLRPETIVCPEIMNNEVHGPDWGNIGRKNEGISIPM